jgi:hypothetical protein
MSAQNSGLLFFSRQPSKDESHGIYTKILQNAIIEFTFRIDELATSSSARNTDVDFGIVPANEPDPTKGLIFLLEVQSLKQNDVYLKLDEPSLARKFLVPHYNYKQDYKVKLELNGLLFNAVIDGDDKVINTRSIPFSERAFWIGFTIPNGGTLSVSIKNISIQ